LKKGEKSIYFPKLGVYRLKEAGAALQPCGLGWLSHTGRNYPGSRGRKGNSIRRGVAALMIIRGKKGIVSRCKRGWKRGVS